MPALSRKTCRRAAPSRYSAPCGVLSFREAGMVWEQRWHPLRREWVIVSAHRNERPWQGERVAEPARALAPYVSDCYLCPGNVRSSAVGS